jgi:hypothetical protein
VGDKETLWLIVLRARRVHAHSIVPARHELQRHAYCSFDRHLDLAGRMTEPCSGRFEDHDRVRLRRARLVLYGQIVHSMRHPAMATTETGTAPDSGLEATT